LGAEFEYSFATTFGDGFCSAFSGAVGGTEALDVTVSVSISCAFGNDDVRYACCDRRCSTQWILLLLRFFEGVFSCCTKVS
jgi:hypothetical protein